MNTCLRVLTTLVFAAACVKLSASELDRDYRMGDDAGEATSNGAAITNGGSVNVLTRDSQGVAGQSQLIHLGQVNTPTYRTISDRPDGVSSFGIEFNAAQSEYLHGPRLGNPSTSISFLGAGATLNYNGIVDRGMQFWVKPASTAVQTLVMDTNQHGVRIDASGKFSMRYRGADFASNITVTPGTWYHVEVVRPTLASGSRMFIDGKAVAVASGNYSLTDTADLTVGSNTAGDANSFTGGTAEFFSGIVDDLKMFVIGSAPLCTAPTCTPDRPAHNFGAFNLAVDNAYADWKITGVAGDLSGNGSLGPEDKTAFINGWLDKKTVGGVQIGDLETYQSGDLNLDGITNLFDLVIMQSALAGGGMGGITQADLYGGSAPEPASAMLLLTAVAPALLRRNRRHSGR